MVSPDPFSFTLVVDVVAGGVHSLFLDRVSLGATRGHGPMGHITLLLLLLLLSLLLLLYYYYIHVPASDRVQSIHLWHHCKAQGNKFCKTPIKSGCDGGEKATFEEEERRMFRDSSRKPDPRRLHHDGCSLGLVGLHPGGSWGFCRSTRTP